jgi:hypothetical protein
MPRFYFDMVEDGVTVHDNDGVEMPSAKLARRAAAAIVAVIAYDRATKDLAPALLSSFETEAASSIPWRGGAPKVELPRAN